MGNDQYYSPNGEEETPEDRIRRIREGGASQPPPQPSIDEEPIVSGGRASRSEQMRQEISGRGSRAAASQARQASTATAPASSRGRQAILVIGGVVAIGVVIVLVLFVISAMSRGGGISLPFLATATATPTATSTATPVPTETPTATATKEAPALALPPLTCIFQSGVGCFDYCQQPENEGECNSARDFVAAQGADPAVWLDCIASGPGPNTGNPQKCLEDAWRSNNP